MQTPVKEQLHPSVKKSLFLDAAMDEDVPCGVLDMLDVAVARDGPGRE